MAEEMQAPIARGDFQVWAWNTYRLYGKIRLVDGSVLGCTKYELLPEVNALFIGSPENLHATMDLCGLYDKRLGEFRFITKELAAVVDGLAAWELWKGSRQGPNLLQLVTSYVEYAAAHGYKTRPYMEEYNQKAQTVQAGLDAMTVYAGVLAARRKAGAVLELRSLAMDMRAFWQDGLYTIYEKAGLKMEQRYAERFDRAVTTASESGQPPVFSAKKARAILRGLSVHVEEEAVGNGSLYAVWRCSHLVRRILIEHPRIRKDFCGRFEPDFRNQYTEFKSAGCISLPDKEPPAKGMEMGGM